MGVGFGNHIIQYAPEYSVCLGCKTCEMVCALVHDGMTGPQLNRITCQLDSTRRNYHEILSCQQCDDHPCYDACPKKDEAMCIDPETNIAYVNQENCIGCGMCQRNCKFPESRINVVRGRDKDRSLRKAKKCDLCRDREGGPACVAACPARCIGLSDDPLPYDSDALPKIASIRR